MKYYAIVQRDGDGPTWGIGTTEADAWDDAGRFGVDETDRDWCVCVEITRAAYDAIRAGNPDAVIETTTDNQ